MLINMSNNTYTPGYATESWYNSIYNLNDKDKYNQMISNKTKEYGFGVICVSNGCIAIAYYYPSDTTGGYLNIM